MPIAGDVNLNGATDVADVQCTTLVTLWQMLGEQGTGPFCVAGDPTRTDLSCSEGTELSDIQIVITLALKLPLSTALDADANGCVDGCQTATVAGCQSDTDCQHSCPETAHGCVCAHTPAGMGVCLPSCTGAADCPALPSATPMGCIDGVCWPAGVSRPSCTS